MPVNETGKGATNYEVARTDEEIEEVIKEALFHRENPISDVWNESYHEGVQKAIEWLVGISDESPIG